MELSRDGRRRDSEFPYHSLVNFIWCVALLSRARVVYLASERSPNLTFSLFVSRFSYFFTFFSYCTL